MDGSFDALAPFSTSARAAMRVEHHDQRTRRHAERPQAQGGNQARQRERHARGVVAARPTSMFWRITRIVRRASTACREARRRGELDRSTTQSERSIGPPALPSRHVRSTRRRCARTGASLTPSPSIATTCCRATAPLARAASFRFGRQRAPRRDAEREPARRSARTAPGTLSPESSVTRHAVRRPTPTSAAGASSRTEVARRNSKRAAHRPAVAGEPHGRRTPVRCGAAGVSRARLRTSPWPAPAAWSIVPHQVPPIRIAATAGRCRRAPRGRAPRSQRTSLERDGQRLTKPSCSARESGWLRPRGQRARPCARSSAASAAPAAKRCDLDAVQLRLR